MVSDRAIPNSCKSAAVYDLSVPTTGPTTPCTGFAPYGLIQERVPADALHWRTGCGNLCLDMRQPGRLRVTDERKAPAGLWMPHVPTGFHNGNWQAIPGPDSAQNVDEWDRSIMRIVIHADDTYPARRHQGVGCGKDILIEPVKRIAGIEARVRHKPERRHHSLASRNGFPAGTTT
jgi:hypothetical protein